MTQFYSCAMNWIRRIFNTIIIRYHHELKTLDLSGNPLTAKSGDVLLNLTKKLKNCKIKADGNAGKKLI